MRAKTKSALKDVNEAQTVPELYAALVALRGIDEEVYSDLEVPPIRDYSDWPEVDWSVWSEHIVALAADDTLVLFREGSDRLFTMTWDDILDDEE